VENVKKCKNFFSTLLRLASQQPAETLNTVKKLIQNLVVSCSGMWRICMCMLFHSACLQSRHCFINDLETEDFKDGQGKVADLSCGGMYVLSQQLLFLSYLGENYG